MKTPSTIIADVSAVPFPTVDTKCFVGRDDSSIWYGVTRNCKLNGHCNWLRRLEIRIYAPVNHHPSLGSDKTEVNA